MPPSSRSGAVQPPMPEPTRGAAHPRLSAHHWTAGLSRSPQLRAELAAAGVDVQRLHAYAEAARSKPVQLSQLERFMDPRPRGFSSTQPLAHTSAAATASAASSAHPVGWDHSAHLDWILMNGSREISLGVSETAIRHPDTEAGRRAGERLTALAADAAIAGKRGGRDPQRITDRRSGHKLSYALPAPKERFVQDAYYLRIVDQRKSAFGKAPEKRLPEPTLYNGECREQQPKDEDQRKVVEQWMEAKNARTQNLTERTRHNWAPTAADGAAQSALEWRGTQCKLQALKGCPAAGENTYHRLFQLDLPVDSAGFRGAPRSAAQIARAQHLRDCTSHGRDYDVVSSVATRVVPPSVHAQTSLKLSAPNAIGRERMDQRHAAQRAAGDAQSQQQQQQQDQLQ